MGICLTILVGYEKDRHLFGIRHLSKLGINRIYLLYDNIHYDYQKYAERNVKSIWASVSKLFETESRGCDPRDITDLARNFTYIMGKNEPSELYIDVTNSTKEAYMTAAVFSMAFGAKMYCVVGDFIPLDARIDSVFRILEDDKELIDKFSQRVQGKDNRDEYKTFLTLLREKYKEGVEKQHEERKANYVRVIPLTGDLVKSAMSDLDEKILLTILKIEQEKSRVESIAELAQHLGFREKSDIASVGYRIRQLENWGFIKAERNKRTKITLSELGKGFAMGLLELKSEAA
jgi:hypothetical protein